MIVVHSVTRGWQDIGILLGGMGETQLPIRCLTEGCLVTSLMMSYRHFSKTYCRKSCHPRTTWGRRRPQAVCSRSASHRWMACGTTDLPRLPHGGLRPRSLDRESGARTKCYTRGEDRPRQTSHDGPLAASGGSYQRCHDAAFAVGGRRCSSTSRSPAPGLTLSPA